MQNQDDWDSLNSEQNELATAACNYAGRHMAGTATYRQTRNPPEANSENMTMSHLVFDECFVKVETIYRFRLKNRY